MRWVGVGVGVVGWGRGGRLGVVGGVIRLSF